jgi:hypothetical protein
MSKAHAIQLVGRVVWGDEMTTASLYADGSWDVSIDGKPVPAIAASLSSVYADAYRGPQDGPFGWKILTELADRMGGTLILEDDESPGAGEIS